MSRGSLRARATLCERAVQGVAQGTAGVTADAETARRLILSSLPPPNPGPEIAERLQQLRQGVPERAAAAVLRRPPAHQQHGPEPVPQLLLRQPRGGEAAVLSRLPARTHAHAGAAMSGHRDGGSRVGKDRSAQRARRRPRLPAGCVRGRRRLHSRSRSGVGTRRGYSPGRWPPARRRT